MKWLGKKTFRQVKSSLNFGLLRDKFGPLGMKAHLFLRSQLTYSKVSIIRLGLSRLLEFEKKIVLVV